MRNALTILSLLAIVLTGTLSAKKAEAADNITHLYTSILVANASGIDINYALSMGVGNEMIDRGIWTTPMGLPTPRLLFHFMGSPVTMNVNEGGLKKGLALATIDHPLFYNMLDRGMKTKSPIYLGAALHLLIDTFYHAGYSNLLGHAEGGHRPDMPYDEVEKAKLCLQAIVELNFLIRDLLEKTPDYSIMERMIAETIKDKNFAEALMSAAGVKSVTELTSAVSKRPDLFTKVILKNPKFRDAIFTNMEKTDQYFRLAIEHIFAAFKTKGIVTLEEADLGELSHAFKDLMSRNDVDPMESFKIFVYRILQLQDAKLTKRAEEEMIDLGYDYKKFEKILEKGHFDFSEIFGVPKPSDIVIAIDNNAKKNEDTVRFLMADIRELISQITVKNAEGKTTFLKTHDWSQSTHTLANMVLPEMLSWMSLINREGNIRTVEHRDLGKIFSTQTDVAAAYRIIDRFPQYLEENADALEIIALNPKKLQLAARLKSIAEVANHISNNATKDLFPGKLSPIKKVIYEDDSLPHACFAKACREEAAKNLVAELTNVNIASQPKGFHTIIIDKIKAAVRFFNPRKTVEVVDEKQAEINALIRDYNLQIGLATKDINGNIIMSAEMPGRVEARPNLTVSGYLNWTAFTSKYMTRIQLKFSKQKNLEILKYIKNGEQTKAQVIQALNEKYYYPSYRQGYEFHSKYGGLPMNESKYRVKGLIIRCEKLFSY